MSDAKKLESITSISNEQEIALGELRSITTDLVARLVLVANEVIGFYPFNIKDVADTEMKEVQEFYNKVVGHKLTKPIDAKLLPVDVFNEYQCENVVIPEEIKKARNFAYNSNRNTSMKYRIVTGNELKTLDKVQLVCINIAYSAINAHFKLESEDTDSTNALYKSNLKELYKKISTASLAAAKEDPTSWFGSHLGVKNFIMNGSVAGFRELAYLVHMTPWHFHRLFDSFVGVTVKEYGNLCLNILTNLEFFELNYRYKISNTRDKCKDFVCPSIIFQPFYLVDELQMLPIFDEFNEDIKEKIEEIVKSCDVSIIYKVKADSYSDQKYFYDFKKTLHYKKTKRQNNGSYPLKSIRKREHKIESRNDTYLAAKLKNSSFEDQVKIVSVFGINSCCVTRPRIAKELKQESPQKSNHSELVKPETVAPSSFVPIPNTSPTKQCVTEPISLSGAELKRPVENADIIQLPLLKKIKVTEKTVSKWDCSYTFNYNELASEQQGQASTEFSVGSSSRLLQSESVEKIFDRPEFTRSNEFDSDFLTTSPPIDQERFFFSRDASELNAFTTTNMDLHQTLQSQQEIDQTPILTSQEVLYQQVLTMDSSPHSSVDIDNLYSLDEELPSFSMHYTEEQLANIMEDFNVRNWTRPIISSKIT